MSKKYPEFLLTETLKQHQLWVQSLGRAGEKCYLDGANLTNANLTGAFMTNSCLVGAKGLDSILCDWVMFINEREVW